MENNNKNRKINESELAGHTLRKELNTVTKWLWIGSLRVLEEEEEQNIHGREQSASN